MDENDYGPVIRRNIVPIFLGTVGLVLLLFGLFQIISTRTSEPSIIFEEEKEEDSFEIVVDIEGAVINPGVYKLNSDERVVDALAKAGGLAEVADRDWVEKNVNLAGKLTDGLKIYIPRQGEEILSAGSSESAAGPVMNINNASVADLKSLPGVGDVTAQKIIDGRPYGSVNELLEKKIVGSATYDKIKDKIAAN